MRREWASRSGRPWRSCRGERVGQVDWRNHPLPSARRCEELERHENPSPSPKPSIQRQAFLIGSLRAYYHQLVSFKCLKPFLLFSHNFPPSRFSDSQISRIKTLGCSRLRLLHRECAVLPIVYHRVYPHCKSRTLNCHFRCHCDCENSANSIRPGALPIHLWR